MNANELADKSFMRLWDAYTSKNMECEDLEEKLRQQQAEIEALKKEAALQRLSDFTQEAEIKKLKQTIDANNLSQNIGQFVKPAKTLTDEEIIKTAINWAKENHADIFTEPTEDEEKMLCSLIRAILRKAQE